MVPRENVHSQFSMILQVTWLFEGTIRGNIIYSKKGITEEEVMKACKTVGRTFFDINIFLICLNNMKFALSSDKKGI